MRILPGIAFALSFATTCASAQEVRYQIKPTDEGYTRIDQETGAISTCTQTGDQLVCQMAVDERDALLDTIDSLEARVAELERNGGSGLPTNEEIDRTLGVMERFMRGFAGIVRDLEEPQG